VEIARRRETLSVMSELLRDFTKGHGTENDFVLLPDLDGTRDVSAEQVRRLADRRAGIGGDGVIRVVPTSAAVEPEVRAQAGAAPWFMDYRNADGGLAELCGNGTRVFAAYLRRAGLETGAELRIATRAGVKTVRFESDAMIAVNLGGWGFVGPAAATRGNRTGTDATTVVLPGYEPLEATLLNLGNPHTVVRLPAGTELSALNLTTAPVVRPVPEHGTNVEVVEVLAPGHLRMRVHERGVGETRSCGTGAAAAALAARRWTGDVDDVWRVDVPGGTLRVTALAGNEVELAGPAELVADGVVHL